MNGYILRRGEHVLPHQSQQVGKDLDAVMLYQNPGARSLLYHLTPEQTSDFRFGPYTYVVRYPNHPGLAWTAFYTEDALRIWLRAYDITVVGEIPEPGGSTYVVLPVGVANWQRLTRDEVAP